MPRGFICVHPWFGFIFLVTASHGLLGKKIVYFYETSQTPRPHLRQRYSTPDGAWTFSGTWRSPRKLSGLEFSPWRPAARTNQSQPRLFKPIQDPPRGGIWWP